MGDYKTNLSALVEAQRISDTNAGLLHNANTIAPIEFAHPQGLDLTPPTGLELGASVSCLMLMLSNPATPYLLKFSGRKFYLGLDPKLTAPNAQIGVMFTQTAGINEHIILSPGDIIHVPQGFEQIWCYNASLVKRITGLTASSECGFCRFMASKSRDCLVQYAKVNVNPQASIIARNSNLPMVTLGNHAGVGNCTLISSGNLEEIDVQLYGVDAATIARSGWNCGIGLFTVNRNFRSLLELNSNIEVNPFERWTLVEEQSASGIGNRSDWVNNANPSEGNNHIFFKNFPKGAVLQIARTTLINSFDTGAVVTKLQMIAQGRFHATGFKEPQTRVIYDADSADVNTEIDTGVLSCAGFESLKIFMEPDGVAIAAEHILYEVYEDGTEHPIQSVTNAAGALAFTINVGFQFDMIGTVIGATMDCAGPVPHRIRMHVEALGDDAGCHLRITGRTRG